VLVHTMESRESVVAEGKCSGNTCQQKHLQSAVVDLVCEIT